MQALEARAAEQAEEARRSKTQATDLSKRISQLQAELEHKSEEIEKTSSISELKVKQLESVVSEKALKLLELENTNQALNQCIVNQSGLFQQMKEENDTLKAANQAFASEKEQ